MTFQHLLKNLSYTVTYSILFIYYKAAIREKIFDEMWKKSSEEMKERDREIDRERGIEREG